PAPTRLPYTTLFRAPVEPHGFDVGHAGALAGDAPAERISPEPAERRVIPCFVVHLNKPQRHSPDGRAYMPRNRPLCFRLYLPPAGAAGVGPVRSGNRPARLCVTTPNSGSASPQRCPKR